MGTDVIADYLEVLRVELGHRRDVDDVAAEAEDHLRAHAEAEVAAGADPDDAALDAVRAFGEPRVVARAHLRTSSGRLAVPTEATRTAGFTAMVAGGLWVVLAVWGAGFLVEHVLAWPVPFQSWYFLAVAALSAAAVLMCTTAVALRERHGGVLGPLWYVGVVGLVLGAFCALTVGWAVPVWMTLLAIGSAFTAVAVLRRPIAPIAPTVVSLVAMPCGLAVYALAQAVELGRADEYGDRPAAMYAALTVGCLLSAVAMVTTGRWLRGEQPYVDLESLPAPPA